MRIRDPYVWKIFGGKFLWTAQIDEMSKNLGKIYIAFENNFFYFHVTDECAKFQLDPFARIHFTIIFTNSITRIL